MQARLYDHERNLLAIFDRHSGMQWSRKPSAVTQMSVSLPRNDEKVADVQLARYVYFANDGGAVKTSGKIVERQIDKDVLTLTCASEESLLQQTLCPSGYGEVLSNFDLADLVRACLNDWRTIRIKTVEQWPISGDHTVEVFSIEGRDIDNGALMLLRAGQDAEGNETFQMSGYAVYRFKASDIPNFVKWDRVRWQSDYTAPLDSSDTDSDALKTTIQIRYADTVANLPAWSTITPQPGVLTDTVGFPVLGFESLGANAEIAEIVEVRCNLESNNNLKTPAFYALELIARTEGLVTEGSITQTGITIKNLEADHKTSFDLISDACTQAQWEFEVVAGKLNLTEEIGSDKSATKLLTTGARERHSG